MATEQQNARTAWDDNYRQTRELIASLETAELELPSDNPGWTVRSLAAHLASADVFVKMCLKPIANGKGLVPITLPNWAFNIIGNRSNASTVKKYASASSADLIAALDDAHKQALNAMNSFPAEGWTKRGNIPTLGKLTLDEFLRNQIKHNDDHASTLHKAIGR